MKRMEEKTLTHSRQAVMIVPSLGLDSPNVVLHKIQTKHPLILQPPARNVAILN